MRNTCQFCDKNPGYLQGFAKAWVCNDCMYLYGLHDHPKLSNEVHIGVDDEYGDVAYSQYTEYGWEQHQPRRYKPLRAKVIIEELECDPNNLAVATHYVRTLPDAKKVDFKAKKWEIEVWY